MIINHERRGMGSACNIKLLTYGNRIVQNQPRINAVGGDGRTREGIPNPHPPTAKGHPVKGLKPGILMRQLLPEEHQTTRRPRGGGRTAGFGNVGEEANRRAAWCSRGKS